MMLYGPKPCMRCHSDFVSDGHFHDVCDRCCEKQYSLDKMDSDFAKIRGGC